jgi:GNAT superfamily N-acetyltransferase
VRPANRAAWEHLQAIFGDRGYASHCQCQWFKLGRSPRDERAAALREQTNCGRPRARQTSGLVAYLGEVPVGWCAVEPRSAYPRLPRQRTVMRARNEDPLDDSVWAVTCFVTRAGYRRRGITYALARAAVDHARAHGARAVEAYPMITDPTKEITWGELHVGSHWVFADAGFREVSRPTLRRLVMRIDFDTGTDHSTSTATDPTVTRSSDHG